jgi:ABC-type antimicrobial peptide transport system permease subunit
MERTERLMAASLIFIVVLSVLGSLLPASRATRISVRQSPASA